MERTKKNEAAPIEGRKTWRKVGGGTTYLTINGRKRIIKPMEEFEAFDDEIPQSFRDIIICLNGDRGSIPKVLGKLPKPESVKPVPVTYTLEESEEEEGMFNVKDSKGKIVNQKPVTKEKAEQFIQDLNS